MTGTNQSADLAYAGPTRPPVQNMHKMQTYGALFAIVGITVLCILFNEAGQLRILFPVLSVCVGAILLWRHKPLYVGFVCWLWFITPFLSRMADYQGGWTPANSVELAPYVTTGIAGFPLLTSLRSLANRKTLPYLCALVAILYGLILGFTYLPLFNILRALLTWLVPVVFGLFVYENRHLYPEFRWAIEKSFLYGVLVLGVYGIYQFFYLPEWDRMWLLNVRINSFGDVVPMRTRAFSTMNAPPVLASAMACGLLLLFNERGKLRMLSAAAGFLALILTLSRGAWLNFGAGCIYLMIFTTARERLRLALAGLACLCFLVGLAQFPGMNEVVILRLRSFTQLSKDASFSARIVGHEAALLEIAQEPWGEGMGSTDTFHNTEGDEDKIGPHDSTVLEFLYSLGWIGTLIYGFGLFLLVVQLFRAGRGDSFVLASKAILAGFFAQSLLNSVMLGVLGFMVWTFASMVLAQADWAESPAEAPQHEARHAAGYAVARSFG